MLMAFFVFFVFFFFKTPIKKPGDGRKVTFFEPGSGDENGTGKCDLNNRLPLNVILGFAWVLNDSRSPASEVPHAKCIIP